MKVTPDLVRPSPSQKLPVVLSREEVRGFLIGGFELNPKAWSVQDVAWEFTQQLPPPEWDVFEPLMEGAIRRVPVLEVVNVETIRLNAYTEADQRVLETVAAQIAIAIQNARLYDQVQRHAAELEQKVAERTEELRRRRDELAVLYETSLSITLATDLEVASIRTHARTDCGQRATQRTRPVQVEVCF